MAKREVILELTVAGPAFDQFAKFTQQQNTAREATKALKKELRELDKEAENYAAEVERINKELAKQDIIASNAGIQMRELRNELNGATDAGLRFRDKMAQAFGQTLTPLFDKLSGSLDKTQQEMAQALKTFGAESVEFRKAAESVERLERGMNELKDAQRAASAAIVQFGENSKEFKEANDRLKGLEETARNLALEVAEQVEPKFVALSRQLREARREAQEAAEKFGFMSDEFRAAAERADDLEDQMKAVNATVQSIDTEGKIETFGRALQGVTGAFSLAQGAAALFGSESKAVEEALLKVQAAIAIQQGVAGLIEGAKAAKALALSLGLVGPAATAGTAGINGMKAALIASGIGAAVVLIGALAAGVIDFGDAANEAAKNTEKLLNSIDRAKELDAIEKAFQKSRESIRRNLRDALTDEDDFNAQRVNLAEDYNADIEQLEADKTLAYERQRRIEQQLAGDISNEERERLNAALEEQVRIIEDAGREKLLVQEQYEADVRLIERAETKAVEEQENERIRIAKEAAQKRAEERKKAAEQERQEQIKRQAEESKLQADSVLRRETLINGYLDSQLTALQREENAIREKYFAEIQAAEEGSQERILLEKALQEELNKVRAIAAAKKMSDDAAIEEEERRLFAEAMQARVETIGALSNAIGGVAQLMGEQTAAGKAFATAQALINTYLGATQALSDVTIPNTFARIAASIAVITSGLAAVRRIQGFEEGGYTSKKASNHEAVGVVHANEWVAPAWMVKSPAFAPILGQLEDFRKMRGLTSTTDGFFLGGRTTRGTALVNSRRAPDVPGAVITSADLARAIRGINMQPVVRVTDIIDTMGSVVRVNQASAL